MRFRIDIETYGTEEVIDSFECVNYKDALQWWNKNWVDKFIAEKCNFSLYANGKQLKFSQAFDLGFYDKIKNRRAKK